MKIVTTLFFLILASFGFATAGQQDYAGLKSEAEVAYGRESYTEAHRSYEAARLLELSDAQRLWVRFRLADTEWRAAGASRNPDATKLDAAREALTELLGEWKREEEHDDIWAQVQESLGDWYWWRRQSRNFGGAWPFYEKALQHWGASTDLDLARGHYLAIVHKIVDPPGANSWQRRNSASRLPEGVLLGAQRIAQSDNDIARLNHYVAQRGQYNSSDPVVHERTRQAFLKTIEIGPKTDVYDDALYEYGVWLEEHGELKQSAERGTWTEPDYVAALAVFRRLHAEYDQGESAYWTNARDRIKKIVGDEVSLSVGQVFLPGSELGFHVRWRNVDEIQFSLYPVDLTRAVALQSGDGSNDWLASIDLGRLEGVARWSHSTEDDGRHRRGSAELGIERELAAGAYVLAARAGAASSRELVLISDAALVAKTHGEKLSVWFADVHDGRPVSEAHVRLWERRENNEPWNSHVAQTGAEGLAHFALGNDNGNRRQYFLAATDGARQAFALAWEPWRQGSGAEWRIYAHSDRAAYRPGQTVSWKFSARRLEASRYSTPAGATIRWQLMGPTGDVQEKGDALLNDFGSASGTFEPLEAWPLGAYTLRFFEPGSKADEVGAYLGAGELFRLEEYKLPEFLVGVELPTDDEGLARRFHSGERVEVTVTAEYYFGGPLSSGSAEVLVYRRPFWHTRQKPREFSWFYETPNRNFWWGGPGELVSQETLQLDESGHANVAFDTPAGDGQDYEFTIEARVTDSSRREVTGSGRVRVTNQGWFAYLDGDHSLHRPGGEAEVELHALDANDGPVMAQGEIALLRLVWREIWIDPQGREVSGGALADARLRSRTFPPPVKSGERGWIPQVRTYEEIPVTTARLNSDEEGRASWKVRLPEEGYYLVRYTSEDDRGRPVQATLNLWCADSASDSLQYQTEGVQIVLDRDTFREGSPGVVMLSTPASNRWVLFGVETEDLLELRVVHLNGDVKLLSLDVDESWIPNVFLHAVAFHQGLASSDVREVIVPPLEHFLEVEVELDPVENLPGGEGGALIRVRDQSGEPVSAEVSLSLVDASVAAIQGEYAMDPRQFFFGQKRPHAVGTVTSMNQRSYVKLIETETGTLVDERYAWDFEVADESGALGHLKKLGYVSTRTRADKKSRGRQAGNSGPASPSSGPSTPGAGGGVDDFFLGHGMVQADEIQSGIEGGGAGEVHVEVRTDFRETALWLPSVVTDERGEAHARFEYPDSLTNWDATARTLTAGSAFGIARGESRTRLPLLVRLQAPRFFVVGDEVVVSLNLDNRTEAAMQVAPSLAIEGLEVLGFVEAGEPLADAPSSVELPAMGGRRLDWKVRVVEPGRARFVAKVTGPDYGDAVERELPVFPHGIETQILKGGRFDSEGVDLVLDLPAERGAGSTAFSVQVTPSLAITMLDALPYLVDYPYGCTEQTLSRFVPSAVVRRTLENLNVDPAEGMARVYGGIEREFTDKTQRETEASLDQLDLAIRQGLERLYDLQHGDGSWSWWKHGEGDAFMTAYVVWGLSLAQDAQVDVDDQRLARAGLWLGKQLVEAEKKPELQAWMLHAHARWYVGRKEPEQRQFALRCLESLMAKRAALGAYARALLALAAMDLGRDAEARLLAENLIDGVIRDDAPDASIIPIGKIQGGTAAPRAHWGEDGVAYRWSQGGVEATAFALMALVRIDPKHELVEPAADWLVANRRGAQWSNTKTTAIVVLALDEYLRASGQLDRTVGYTIAVNGVEIARQTLSGKDLLAAPAVFEVESKWIRDGQNRVEIRRTVGEGPLFFSAAATFFSQEEPIPPRGNELFVRRQYFKLVGRPTLLKGFQYERVALEDGDSIQSGERVEVVLTIEAKNHLEYLLFEDLKPAGFEATQLKSGESLYARELRRDETKHRFDDEEARSGRGRRSTGESFRAGYTGRRRQLHQELRDRKVALFLDKCPEGVWEIRYDLRAEAPGSFHALPLMGEAMYVPEIRANGAEIRVEVVDRGDV